MKVQAVVFKTQIGTPADLLGDGIQRQKVLEPTNQSNYLCRSAEKDTTITCTDTVVMARIYNSV